MSEDVQVMSQFEANERKRNELTERALELEARRLDGLERDLENQDRTGSSYSKDVDTHRKAHDDTRKMRVEAQKRDEEWRVEARAANAHHSAILERIALALELMTSKGGSVG